MFTKRRVGDGAVCLPRVFFYFKERYFFLLITKKGACCRSFFVLEGHVVTMRGEDWV